MGIKVSIVGATGNVGREFISILNERKFPIDELFLLASSKSHGKKNMFSLKQIGTAVEIKFGSAEIKI